MKELLPKAAKEIGMDQAEFRKKNFISKFPHQQCLVHNIDSGDYNAHLDKALEAMVITKTSKIEDHNLQKKEN